MRRPCSEQSASDIEVNLSPTNTRRYYCNDLLGKRGFEYGHVSLWMIKDLAWIRACDYRIIAFIGVVATAWALVILIWDIFDLTKPSNRKSSIQYELRKEIFTSLGCFIWLFGNSWWAVGENKDLRATAGYNDLYELATAQAKWILIVGFYLLLAFWATNCIIECFGLSRAAYRNRLARHAQHLAKLNRPIRFAPDLLEDYHKTACEHQISSDIEDENCCMRKSSEKNVDSVTEMDIPGMPYKGLGWIGIPKNMPNFKSGETKETRSYQWSKNGVFSFRDFENLIIFFWLWKDLMWLYEDPVWAKVVWFLPVAGVLFVVLDSCATLIHWRKACQVLALDIAHNVALIFWVTCNIVWCYGEMFVSDEIFISFETVEEEFHYIIPPLFTRWENLPPGAWKLRWVAGWLLVVSLGVLAAAYLYFIASDVKELTRTRGGKSKKRSNVALTARMNI